MSKTIDEKVVKLEFDNQNFEKNVKTSMSTLDKLKNKLNFTGATKGLNEIEKASNGINFGKMSSGFGSLSLSIDAVNVAATRLVSNITDSLYNSALSFVKSLSGINLVTEGWSKYESQTTSVQTILSAVSEKINEATGELYNINDVMDVIEKLSWYSDETSYSLEQMTEALGSFTSSGIDLLESQELLMGISNACADAGVSTSMAQYAFTGFSKAIGQGNVTLSLWSNQLKTSGIVNSEKFKQSVLDAAVAVGVLKESSDGLLYTTDLTEKAGELVSIADFTSALTESKWLNTAVLKKVFTNYGDTVDSIYGLTESGKIDTTAEGIQDLVVAIEEAGMSLSDFGLDQEEAYDTASQAITALTNAYKKLGLEVPRSLSGFKRAQEAITFTQAIDSVKTAISSGWAKSFTTMFGDLESASKTWTTLAEDLWEIFASGGDTRNSILSDAFESRWDKFVDMICNAGTTVSAFESSIQSLAENNSEDVESIIDEWGSVSEAIKNGVLSTDYVKQYLQDADHASLLKNLKEQADEANISLDDLLNNLTEKGGRDLLAESIHNFCQAIINLKTIVGNAWNKIFNTNFGNVLYKIISKFTDFTEKIVKVTENASFFSSVLETLLSIFKTIGTIVTQLARGGLSILQKIFGKINIDLDDFAEKISDSLEGFADWLVTNDVLFNLLDNAGDKISGLIDKLGNWCDQILKIDSVKGIINGISDSFKKLTSSTSGASLKDTVLGAFELVKSGDLNLFDDVAKDIAGIFTTISNGAANVKSSVVNTFSSIGKKLEENKYLFSDAIDILEKFISTGIGIGAGYLTLNSLSKLADGFSSIMKPLTAVSDVLGSVKGLFTAGTTYVNKLTNQIKVNTVLKLALAIGILASALFIMAKIDSKALWSSVGALAVISLIIGTLTWAIGKFGSVEGETKNLGKSLVSLAGSLLIIAVALKLLNGTESGNNIGNAIILIGMLAALIFAMNTLSKKADLKIMWMNKTILAIAASLLIMAIALKSLAKMDFNQMMGGIVGFAACIGGLYVLLLGLSKLTGIGKVGWQILLTAVSLFAVISALKKIAKIDADTFALGFQRLAKVFVLYGVLLGTISAISKGAAYSGLAAFALSSSMVALAKAVEMFGTMSSSTIEKGIPVVGQLMILLALVSALLGTAAKFSGTSLKSYVGISVLLLAVCGSLYLIAGAILIFKNIDEATLNNCVEQIVWLLGAMSIVLAAASLLNKGSNMHTMKNIVALIAMIATLALAVFVLSTIDSTKLSSTTKSLVFLLGSLAVVMAVLAGINLLGAKAWVGVLQAITLLGSVAVVLYLLTKFTDADKAISIATALGNLLSQVAISAGIIAAASALFVVGQTAAWSLLGFMGVLGLILVAIGELVVKTESMGELDKIIDVAIKIGELFGKFFGAIVGSSLEQFASYLPQVGESLSEFADSVQKFMDLKADETCVDTAQNICDMLGILLQQDTFNKLKRLNKNKEDFTELSEFLDNYGQIIIDFSNKISGKIDSSAVTAAAEAGTMMATIYDSLPTTSGGLGWIFSGTKSLSDFGNQIMVFADSLIAISNKLGEEGSFDSSTIDTAKQMGDTMVALLDSLPKSGGIWQDWFAGSQNLSNFGEQLKDYAQGLVDLSLLINNPENGFSQEAVDKAKFAGDTMLALLSGLPDSPNLLGAIMGGNKSLSSFGKQIKVFANWLCEACERICDSPVPSQYKLDQVKSAYEMISSFASNIPETSSENAMDSFNTFIDRLISLTDTDLKTVNDGLIDKIKDIITNVENKIQELMNMIVNKFLEIKDALRSGGENALSAILEGLSNETYLNKIYSAGYSAGKQFEQGWNDALGIESPSKVMAKNGSYAVQGIIVGLEDSKEELAESGKNVFSSLGNAIKSAKASVDDVVPTITPVIDFSTVESQLSEAKTTLGSSVLNKASSALTGLQNGALNTVTGNNININFTVNNAGKDLTDSDISKFTAQMASKFNEELGKLLPN